jgi:hypothetical protein
MTVEQICPACGCFVVGVGFRKAGKVYCCEPCAEESQCACGCCAPRKAGRKKGSQNKADKASK